MKRALVFFACLLVAFEVVFETLGYSSAYKVGYGMIATMGIGISLTFLWLWWVRATPLALGMAFSWAGSGLVMGWWWSFNLLGRPEAMRDSRVLFIFLSLYIVGAVMHFRVIQQAMSLPRNLSWVPVGAAALISVAVWALSG